MDIVIQLLIAIALFIYAMKTLSNGLSKLAGNKMGKILEKSSNNLFAGIGTGATVTVATQSSTIVIVTLIALVNASVITLIQAAHIVIGANIGTTLTAFMVAFGNLPITLWLQFTAVIGIVFTFLKNETLKKVGVILIGFALILVSMNMMSDAVRPLREFEWFEALFTNANPLILLIIGAVVTMIINSSSAVIAIVVSMVSQGVIGLDAALFVTLGTYIGTTSTGFLAAAGSSNPNAKRVAMFHFLYNVITVFFINFVFLLIINPETLESFLQNLPSPAEGMAQNCEELESIQNSFNVAWFNLLAKSISAIPVLPFVKLLVKLCERIFPDRIENFSNEDVEFIIHDALARPEEALKLATLEIARVTSVVQECFEMVSKKMLNEEKLSNSKFYKAQNLIKTLNISITNYLIEIANQSLSKEQNIENGNLFHIVTDIQRMVMHINNLHDLKGQLEDIQSSFKENTLEELHNMRRLVREMFNLTQDTLLNKNNTSLADVLIKEDLVDNLKGHFISNHIKKLDKGFYSGEQGMIFAGIVLSFERVADHLVSISEKVIISPTHELKVEILPVTE